MHIQSQYQIYTWNIWENFGFIADYHLMSTQKVYIHIELRVPYLQQTKILFSENFNLKTNYIGLFQKKYKQGGGIWNFQICHFVLGNSRQNEALLFTPGKSTKLCYTHVHCQWDWNFQGQNPRPMEIPHNFFWSPQEISWLLEWPLEFLHFIFSTLLGNSIPVCFFLE